MATTQPEPIEMLASGVGAIDMLNLGMQQAGVTPSYLGTPLEVMGKTFKTWAWDSDSIGDTMLDFMRGRPDLFQGIEIPQDRIRTVDQSTLNPEGGGDGGGVARNSYGQADALLQNYEVQRRGAAGRKDGRTDVVVDKRTGEVVYSGSPYTYDPAKQNLKDALTVAALVGGGYLGVNALAGLAGGGAGAGAAAGAEAAAGTAAGGAGAGGGSSLYSLSTGATGGGAGLTMGGAAPTLTATGSGLATSAQVAAATAAASPYSLAGMGLTATGAGLSAVAPTAAADILAGSVGKAAAAIPSSLLTPAQQAAAGIGTLTPPPPVQPVAPEVLPTTSPVATPPATSAPPMPALKGPPTSLGGIVNAVTSGQMSLKQAAEAMLQMGLGDSAIAQALGLTVGDLARLGVGAAALNKAGGGAGVNLPSNAESLMPGGGAGAGGPAGAAAGGGAFPTTVSGAAQNIVATADQARQQQIDLVNAELARSRPVTDAAVAAQQGIAAQQAAIAQSEYDYASAGQRPLIDSVAQQALQDNTARDAAERQAVVDANALLADQTRQAGADEAQALTANTSSYQGNVAGERAAYDARTAAAAGDFRTTSAGELDRLEAGYRGAADEFRAASASELARFGLGVDSEMSWARGERDSALNYARSAAQRGLSTAYGVYGDAMSRADRTIADKEQRLQGYLDKAQGLGSRITDTAAKYSGRINSDIDLYTSGDSAIRGKYGQDIEDDAALALADTRRGQSAAVAQAMRQARRFGSDTSSMAAQMALGTAAAQAAAANNARRSSTDRYRGLVGEGIGMRQRLMDSDVGAATASANVDMAGLQLGANSMLDGQRLALQRAGLETSTINQIVGMDLDSAYRIADLQTGSAATLARTGIDARTSMAQMGLDSAGRVAGITTQGASERARMGLDSAGRILDTGMQAADRQAAMGMDSWGRIAGMNADAIGTRFAGVRDANVIAARSPSMARDMRIADDQRVMSNRTAAAALYDGAFSRANSAAGRVIEASNAASVNAMRPGEFALGGRQYADTTALTARQQAMGGLTNVMNANVNLATNKANNSTAKRGQDMDMWGTVGGFVLSDRRMKTGIRRVGTHPRGFGVYRYRYITGGPEHVGVMADEVQRVLPEAVGRVGRFLSVDYSRL